MTQNSKLELQWIGKAERPSLEPRILLEDPSLSHRSARRTPGTSFDNRLIFGDNLLALKALEQEFTGKIKCIVIDPPYNTGSAFAQYDDGLEHSLWLSLMRDRIELLWRLLAPDGSFWMTLDDNEAHYAKVLCDEIFGRSNFVHNAVWQKRSAPLTNATWLSDSHDHILIYAKDKKTWRPNLMPRTAEVNEKYKQTDEHDGVNPDGSPRGRGLWFGDNFTLSLRSGARGKQFAKTGKSDNVYTIITPSGKPINPPPGTCWRYPPDKCEELRKDNRLYFGKNGDSRPTYKRFLAEVGDLRAMTVWHYEEVGENRHATLEAKAINATDPFATPKPERLIYRILTLATNPGDWVLDSFAGSGTTGAVAHKMNRRWIMVELHEQIHTHIAPRLKAVIDGADALGVTEETNWKGGGGYKYFRLAPTLIEKDQWSRPVISKKYNSAMLAEAICKLEGFVYSPSADLYWAHGRSTETDYIFITTQALTRAQLEALNDEVGAKRSLLVCCGAFLVKDTSVFPNLTLKKIPKAVLSKCEWGRDDYSLHIVNGSPPAPLEDDDDPPGEPDPGPDEGSSEAPVPSRKKKTPLRKLLESEESDQ